MSSTEEKLSIFIDLFIKYVRLQTFFQAANHGAMQK